MELDGQLPLFDLVKSREAKQAGIESVSRDGTWVSDVLYFIITTYRNGDLVKPEQIRGRWLAHGNPPPVHHNAWGAVFTNAKRLGILRDTGGRSRSAAILSHARETTVYRVCR